MELQIHIADSTGDAVIISPGPDGELAYTRISPVQDFLLSSNFNHAIPGNGKQGWRYDTAYTMLSQTNTYTSEYARDVLDAVKLDMVTTFTLTSTVADLKKREITIFYLSQFNEGVTLSIDDELIKGQRILPLEDFFSSSTVEAGKTAYRKFKIRFRAAQAGFILLVGCNLLFVFLFLRKRIRRHKP